MNTWFSTSIICICFYCIVNSSNGKDMLRAKRERIVSQVIFNGPCWQKQVHHSHLTAADPKAASWSARRLQWLGSAWRAGYLWVAGKVILVQKEATSIDHQLGNIGWWLNQWCCFFCLHFFQIRSNGKLMVWCPCGLGFGDRGCP